MRPLVAACVIVLVVAAVASALEDTPAGTRSAMVRAVKIKLPRSLAAVQKKLSSYYKNYRARIDKRASLYYERIQKEAAKLKPEKAREKFVKANLQQLTRWRNKQQRRLNKFVKRKAKQIGKQWKKHIKRRRQQLKNKSKNSSGSSSSSSSKRKSDSVRVRKELERTRRITRQLTNSMQKHHRRFHKQAKRFERKMNQRTRIQQRRERRRERQQPRERRSRQNERERRRQRTAITTRRQKRTQTTQAVQQWWKRTGTAIRRKASRKIVSKSVSEAAGLARAPPAPSQSTNTTANNTAATNRTLTPATISKCIKVVARQVCCQKNNVQPCCQQAQQQQQNVRFIPPSNNNRPKWTPQTANWFKTDRPNNCVSHACKMRFRRNQQRAAAQAAEDDDEQQQPEESENSEENSNEGAQEEDESPSESDSSSDDDTDDSFLELDAVERAEVRGCVRVVKFCASTPRCAAKLPSNMVTWLDRKRSDGKADQVVPNANPRRTPSAWNYAKGGLDWTDGLCSSGKMQSPIAIPENQLNLTTNQNEFAGNRYQVRFNYQPLMNLTITHHHGYAISVKPNVAGALGHLVAGCCSSTRYHVIGFHFHAKSEHTFPTRNKEDGGHYPMEMHIMHQKEGSTGNNDLISVVIVFQLKRTPGNNKFLDSLNWSSLPKNIGDSAVLSSFVNLNDLGDSLNGDYFAYNGSLTTPGCPENVEYRIMSQPQSLPQSQLDSLLSIINKNPTEFPGGHGNYREVQPRNGRSIVLFKRHTFSNAFQPHSRKFVWVRTERPSPGAVLKLN